MKQNKKYITLEESLERLENIVTMLESNKTNIDDSMHLYKEGMDLIKNCELKINDTEKQIKLLIKENGIFSEEVMDE